MTNYKEIIRLHSLGLNKTRIAESCGCARSTVITALHKAEENGLSWNAVKNLSSEEVTRKLYPATSMGQRYSMPDYEWVHKEMQKSGVTLSLLWVEYCERCRQNGELPYGRRFTSKHELVQMIQQYIRYYNTRRVQRNLGVLTPMEKHALCLAA